MKILWLVHLEPDYGEAMLYDGLCRVLGDSNVVDFPYKYAHHGEVERVQNKNIRKYMEASNVPVSFDLSDPRTYLRQKGQESWPYEWMMLHKGIDYDYADILSMANRKVFDLIVLAHPRSVAMWYLDLLFKDLGNLHQKAPVVMCDFEDYYELRHDVFQRYNINLAFKASYVQNEPNVYGLPLCSPIVDNPNLRFDDSHKTIHVTARWGITHPLRQKVLNEIRQVQAEIRAVGTLPYREYLNEIALSKIGVSMGGHGNLNRNPNRQWEIPSYRTMLLCENPMINYPYPFENGKHCVFFDPNTENDVIRKIEHYINHDRDREMIAIAGHEHLKKYHTTVARAKYFLDICTKYYPQLKGK